VKQLGDVRNGDDDVRDRIRELLWPLALVAIVATVYCAAAARANEDAVERNSRLPGNPILKALASEAAASIDDVRVED
jgi:hypothetical protein